MIELIAKRLSEVFADDPSSPSVIVSWLEDKKQWYVNLVRYLQPFGQGRMGVLKHTDPSLDVCLKQCAVALGLEVSSGS